MKTHIFDLATRLGYDLVGLAPARIPVQDGENLQNYLAEQRHGSMQYMTDHASLRLDPRRVFAEARSALVLGSYYRDLQSETLLASSAVKIARYAHGRDYHKYLRKRGKRLLQAIQQEIPETRGRIVVDSAPVMEKVLGRLAGIGWRGKHTNLIHPELGSYFFISVLFLNLDLPADQPLPDLCRDCDLCIQACPTNALQDYKIDARLCISYQTIERKAESNLSQLDTNRAGWAFGCDICQEVCPYNRNRRGRAQNTRDAAFQLRPALASIMQTGEIPVDLQAKKILTSSALRRAGLQQLRANFKLARQSLNTNAENSA